MSDSKMLAYLRSHSEEKPISFHIPGHKSKEILKKYGYEAVFDEIMKYDLTEIPGADNLFNAKGIIAEAQKQYAAFYGVKNTFFLVNGTSGGIIAAILSSVRPGKKILVGRDSHKSIRNALILGDIEPLYFYPDMNYEYNIPMGIDPVQIEKMLEENEADIDAVIVTYPNFYGICSDIRKIAEIVHRFGKILIVDEAHGSHLKLSGALPESAIDAGADLVVQSSHKTLLSLTQSSVMHVNSDKIDIERLKEVLQIIQTSSPSYLLMLSLDISRAIMEKDGEKMMADLMTNLDGFYEKIKKIKGIKIIDRQIIGQNFVKNLDRTKINIDISDLGMNGSQVEKLLMTEQSIYLEMVSINNIVAFSSIANSAADFEVLYKGLSKIAMNSGEGKKFTLPKFKFEPLEAKMSLKQAIYAPKKLEKLENAIGKISGSYLIPYPPGIPLICPGETIREKEIVHIQALIDENIEVIGWEEGSIKVLE